MAKRMEAQRAIHGSTAGSTAPAHVRHRPERTLLYQVIEQHYPRFLAHLAASGRTLPRHVQREFEDYLKCGRLEHGFLRVRCEGCQAEKLVAFSCKRRGFCPSCGARRMIESAALGIEYRTIAAHLLCNAGLRRRHGQCRAVTLMQRFGSALNLNVHFHMLIPDGTYLRTPRGPVFRPLAAPKRDELQALVQQIGRRLGRHLERRGVLVRDAENSHLGPRSAALDGQSFRLTPVTRIRHPPSRAGMAGCVHSVPAGERCGIGRADRTMPGRDRRKEAPTRAAPELTGLAQRREF
jgi:ribosomal protein S27E